MIDIMAAPLVSVIIPTYNRAHVIQRALRSVQTQSHTNVEILVIDDGSKDKTQELLKPLCQADPRIRLLSQPNRGVSAARNYGLREARGEWIAFLDSDDVWLSQKLEWQLLAAHRHPELVLVWTDMSAYRPDGQLVTDRYLRTMYQTYRFFPRPQDLFENTETWSDPKSDMHWGSIFSPMVLGNLVHTSTVIFRRRILERVGFFDETLKTGEDYPFHLRCTAEGPAALLDTPLVRYEVGAADALSSPGHLLQVSLNFLTTLENSLQKYKGRVNLPAAVIRRSQSDAHLWVAGEYWQVGDRTAAQRHVRQAVIADLSNYRALKFWLRVHLSHPSKGPK